LEVIGICCLIGFVIAAVVFIDFLFLAD